VRAQSNIFPNFSTKATVFSRRSFARSAFVFSREVASSQGGREGEVAGTAGDQGPPAAGLPRAGEDSTATLYVATIRFNITTCTGLDLPVLHVRYMCAHSTLTSLVSSSASKSAQERRRRASSAAGRQCVARVLFVRGNTSPLFGDSCAAASLPQPFSPSRSYFASGLQLQPLQLLCLLLGLPI